jgi:predicted lysophospholipase L1 biosynthesis ABC-type transport system permease subunit
MQRAGRPDAFFARLVGDAVECWADEFGEVDSFCPVDAALTFGQCEQAVHQPLERRGEIGLRRALGARRAHIGVQFLAESSLLALTGGTAGAIVGGFATTVFAAVRHWDAVVPITALLLAIASALAVGAAAGIYPALKAARFSRAEGLRTT